MPITSLSQSCIARGSDLELVFRSKAHAQINIDSATSATTSVTASPEDRVGGE
jgi:hypothetical protein